MSFFFFFFFSSKRRHTRCSRDWSSDVCSSDLPQCAGLARRIEGTLASVERLEKHEGHLLNWYDTTSLAPLAPRYVSTVDSGNLAGSLMTLAAGLRERAVAVEDDDARCAGAADTAGVLAEMLATVSR